MINKLTLFLSSNLFKFLRYIFTKIIYNASRQEQYNKKILEVKAEVLEKIIDKEIKKVEDNKEKILELEEERKTVESIREKEYEKILNSDIYYLDTLLRSRGL